VILGLALRKNRPVWKLGAFGFAGCTLFFLVTNFAVWALGATYPHTPEGLMACYVAALPFYRNSLLGTTFFGGLLFSSINLRQPETSFSTPAMEHTQA